MSIAQFSKALQSKADQTVNQQATKMLQELLQGSKDLFNEKNPLSIQSGASILSKGTMETVDSNVKDQIRYRTRAFSETFRESGMQQGRTALVLTASDLEIMFKKLNIVNNTGKDPIQLYVNFLVANFGSSYKAKHFEFYVEDAGSIKQDTTSYGNRKLSSIFTLQKDGDYQLKSTTNKIRSFRGLNFSHANVLTHVASFLVYQNSPGSGVVKSGPLIEEMSKNIVEYFERGHVIAQTTGRGKISSQYVTSIKDSSGKEINPVLLLIQLSEKLDIASSGLKNINHELLANIDKDFNPKSPRMNIQFQPKFDESGLGNQDTGRLSTSIALVSTLQRLLNINITQTISQKKAGTVSYSASAKSLDNFAKVLKEFLQKLEKDNDKLYNSLASVLKATNEGPFLADLKSSDSFKDYVLDITSSIFDKKSLPVLKIKSPKVPIKKIQTSKPSLPKLAPAFKKLKSELDSGTKNIKKQLKLSKDSIVTTMPSSATNLPMLMMQINSSLHDQLKKNMGIGNRKDVLNYRSGRFASSAKVERLSESRQGMITAFYSYMKNPYATFSRGGRQDRPYTRDPKLLISKSIRELAGAQVANRMRAVLV
jgi:hypothetical protein